MKPDDDITRDRTPRWLTAAACLALLSAAGCTDSVRQYTRVGAWQSPAGQSTILSGDPARDAAAYSESDEELTEADWQILQQFAPRPIWQKLRPAKPSRPAGAAAATKPAPTVPQPTTRMAPPLPKVPTVVLPDGKIKLFYRLRHVGGPTVKSSYDGGTRRRKVAATPAVLTPLTAVIAEHLAEAGTVLAVPAQNLLVITCQTTVYQSVLELLACLDARPRQVEISARIFEVSSDFNFQLGVRTLLNHMASDNTQAIAGNFSAKAFAGSVVNPGAGNLPDPGSAMRILQVFENAGITFDATFQALADTGLVKVVAAPRMTVAAGETGYMLAGREMPIQSAKLVGDNFVSQSVTYKPLGVQLYVTPQTIGPDSVKLHVVSIVSAVSGFDPLPTMDGPVAAETLVNPIIDSREAETYVTIPDNNTLVISGLRMTRSVTRERKVPGLGDVRGLGWLFKSHRTQRRVNDLYFFLTPHIIQ